MWKFRASLLYGSDVIRSQRSKYKLTNLLLGKIQSKKFSSNDAASAVEDAVTPTTPNEAAAAATATAAEDVTTTPYTPTHISTHSTMLADMLLEEISREIEENCLVYEDHSRLDLESLGLMCLGPMGNSACGD